MSYPGARSRRRRQTQRLPPPIREHLLDSPTRNYGSLMESPRGQLELGTFGELSSYEPPVMERSSTTSRTGWERPRPPTHPAYSIVQRHHNLNPAIDRAWSAFSHGCCCFQCVRTQEIGFTEEWGAFRAILGPGLHCMFWPINTVAGRLSLRVQQLNIKCESRSSEDVFVDITVAVFYRVIVARSYEAFYRLQHPMANIEMCVRDAVQSSVPSASLDFLFSNKDHLSTKIFSQLQSTMREYGYEINQVLITQILPNSTVRDSMNEIAASRSLKLAAFHKGEANKCEIVKKAEAHAERLHYMGVAISRARQAIVEGMKESTVLFSEVDVRLAHPPSQKEIMGLLLVAQYMDVLSSLKPAAILIDPEPDAVLSTLDAEKET